ncbi:diguanylate cyclase [Vibrio astriarenae]|uniref:diguanylate cyclase n=1 Tax=Vibrio astriarenae TaxID=1481923 RepID=A0A7Z2YFW8_9VIBR|nr:sensor domain-containing diguanylate cyclase [Vibrio astriarenae]QIA65851.1 diguanylate cyclase [Vibrio astriarenae]
MSGITLDINEFHWMTQILDTMDSGLVVLDLDNNVVVWNNFMQSYSGISSQNILGRNLFDSYDGLPRSWLEAKISNATVLETRCFSSWENRPYLFAFKNFSPVSHGSQFMYQDVVFTPLKSLCGGVSHIAIQITDVSETAHHKIYLNTTNQQLSELSRKDGLTNLYNRISWEQNLEKEFERMVYASEPSSLVMFDIDHFKAINDTYGHHVGDEVIRATAKLLRKSVRKGDVCGRYGGEEFTVILPNTCTEQARLFAERLRASIEQAKIEHAGQQIKFTISLGVCQYHPSFQNHIAWLNSVDAALYRSKDGGRNQTQVIDLIKSSMRNA